MPGNFIEDICQKINTHISFPGIKIRLIGNNSTEALYHSRSIQNRETTSVFAQIEINIKYF
jgi:hypothetical protein